MRRTHRPDRRRSAARWLLLVGWVLLAMQTLGLMHSVSHAVSQPVPRAALHDPAAAMALAQPEARHANRHGVAALFSGHEAGSATCALYDHLLQPHVLHGMPPLALPESTPPGPAEPHRAWHLALQALGFLARGPPAA